MRRPQWPEDGAGTCPGFPTLGIGFCYARAASGQAVEGDEQPVVLSIPAEFRRVGLGIRRLVDGQALPGQGSKADPKLVKLIVRAHLLSRRLAGSSSE